MIASFASQLALGLALGGLAALVVFGGLWWTLSRLTRFANPRRAARLSLIVRLGLATALFALALKAGPWTLVAAMGGFYAARMSVLIRVSRPQTPLEAKA